MTELTDTERDRLRQALALIGDEAGRVPPGPAHPSPPARRRTLRRVLVTAVGAAVLVTGGLLFALGPDGGRTDRGDGSGSGQTRVESIACARTIVVGDVRDVRRHTDTGRVTVTFAVREWIKPAHGADVVELDLVDPTEARVREPWAVGQHVLVSVPVREDLAADAFPGAQLERHRSDIKRDLAEAERTPCPSYWSTPQP